jgi:transposase
MQQPKENMSKKELLNYAQKLEASYNKTRQENEYLKFRISELQRLLYGSKRERFTSNDATGQKRLPFKDLPKPAQEPKKKEKIEYYRKKPKKKHPGRADFPDHLPEEEIYIEPDRSTEGLKKIGQEVTKELEYVPGKLYVKKYIRPKFADAEKEQVIIGELPSRPIEKGMAGPGLLSQLFVDKYVDHLPIYRQRQRFKRENINIPSSTINSWIKQISDLIEPLYERLKDKVLNEGYLQADETPTKVLDKNKKGKTHQGYHWVYFSPMRKAVFFDYRYGRSREGPKQLLKDFTGYLQTDGYRAYDWFGKRQDITLLGCWAHARRKFEKALDYDRERAGYVMEQIQKLYAVEREARELELDPEGRKQLRLDKALPVINQLGQQLAEMYQDVLPKSPLGDALNYIIPRWDSLLAYLNDGMLEIDNNLVENSIRPNALGRKNYLFAGSHSGAQRAAMFYSFFGTCKQHGVNPWEWLKRVLELIPDYSINQLDDLLPQNLKLD